MIPYKIFVYAAHPAPFWFSDKQIPNMIEYIHKEALLEWAKANLQDRDNWNEKSAADAFCALIDKLNEM